MSDIITNVKKYSSIAIIGLSKNAGKTTTMNYLLKMMNYQNCMLTSIGYDGEETDLIFNSNKPTIFIKENTIIASAKKCLLQSNIQFEIMETTGFNTPLGEVIIARSLNEGLIELAGPSYNEQLTKVIDIMYSFNKDGLVLVDGALNRKMMANPSVCDGTILCTGMSLNKDIDKVVAKTIFTLEIFKSELVDQKIKEIIENNISNNIILDKDNKITKLEVDTLINKENEIIKLLNKNSAYLYIKGPLLDKLMEALITKRNTFKELNIVVNDATKIFISQKVFELLKKTNIKIKLLNKIEIIGISVNPVGINIKVDSKLLINEIKKYTNIPVFNVME
ncbi:MAG: hypothetical protein LBR40_00735 [Bacilli bacterium]|jgi:hypothetical protein|nr:hypothetical protein [Bacilli bacterium]